MAFKTFALDEQTSITIYKKRNSRHIRISIKPDGKIHVSVPTWTPYSVGLQYAKSKHKWIKDNHRPAMVFRDNQKIGKTHYISIETGNFNNISTRVKEELIIVKVPNNVPVDCTEVQNKIQVAAIKALRIQAENSLPHRIRKYSDSHGLKINSISIKNMKSRWGSCDSNKNIVLNLHLMHLPWELIDYVLHHELTHTKIMRHGSDFWREMRLIWPDVDEHRREIKHYQPNFNN